MFAAKNAPEQPLSYLNFGGFSATANLIRFSRFQNVDNLRKLLEPETNGTDENGDPRPPLRRSSEMALIREFRRRKTETLLSRTSLINRERINLQAYNDALSSKENLKEFKNYLPASTELEGRVAANTQTDSDFRDQARQSLPPSSLG